MTETDQTPELPITSEGIDDEVQEQASQGEDITPEELEQLKQRRNRQTHPEIEQLKQGLVEKILASEVAGKKWVKANHKEADNLRSSIQSAIAKNEGWTGLSVQILDNVVFVSKR